MGECIDFFIVNMCLLGWILHVSMLGVENESLTCFSRSGIWSKASWNTKMNQQLALN